MRRHQSFSRVSALLTPSNDRMSVGKPCCTRPSQSLSWRLSWGGSACQWGVNERVETSTGWAEQIAWNVDEKSQKQHNVDQRVLCVGARCRALAAETRDDASVDDGCIARRGGVVYVDYVTGAWPNGGAVRWRLSGWRPFDPTQPVSERPRLPEAVITSAVLRCRSSRSSTRCSSHPTSAHLFHLLRGSLVASFITHAVHYSLTMKTSLLQAVRPRASYRLQLGHQSYSTSTYHRHKHRRRTENTVVSPLCRILLSRPHHHDVASCILPVSYITTTSSSRVVLPASLSGPYPARSPLAKYVTEVRDGRLRPDIRQEKAMQKLQQLWEQTEQYLPPTAAQQPTAHTPSPPATSSSSEDSDGGGGSGFFSFARRLGGIFSHRSSDSSPSPTPTFSPASPAPRGLYMYGGVGCGKTRLMDLYYSCVTSTVKRREHFHHFMLDFHAHLHALRTSSTPAPNPIPTIAQQYAASYKLLCLDEFQVTDVADAMILRTLFTALWAEGVVVVATSNRPPEDLYKNGINRDVFVPFIDELRRACDVHAMEDGQDHRLLGTVDDGVYHYPLDAAADERLAAMWQRLTEGEVVKPKKVTVMMGRFIDVKQAGKQAALFDFNELCNQTTRCSRLHSTR